MFFKCGRSATELSDVRLVVIWFVTEGEAFVAELLAKFAVGDADGGGEWRLRGGVGEDFGQVVEEAGGVVEQNGWLWCGVWRWGWCVG